jgi:tRNA threonylcarbamoyladenosine biosynthesis protein TsaE
MNQPITIHARCLEATLDLGRRIGGRIETGWVIGLVGELGAGKTHLVKGIGDGNREAGAPALEVTSPTFVLVNEYPGRVRLFHVDAYRLRAGAELEDLGIEEMIADGAVAVEWADRVSDAVPADRLTVAGRSVGETHRVWTLIASGPCSREWLRALVDTLPGDA